MDGFDAEKPDELLELEKLELKSTALLAMGYRNEKADWLAKIKKVREPLSEFVTLIN